MAKLLKYEIDAVVEEIYCKLQKDIKIPVLNKDPLYKEYSSIKDKVKKLSEEISELNIKSRELGIKLLKKHNLNSNNFYGDNLDKVFDKNYTSSKNIDKNIILRKVILSNHSNLRDIVDDVIAQINRENY